MAIQFNSTLLNGIANAYFNVFRLGSSFNLSMAFYPTTMAFPAVAPTNANTTGRIGYISNVPFAVSGSTIYTPNGFSFLPELTGTVGWFQLFTLNQTSVAMITDAVSATDPKAAVQVSTMNFVKNVSVSVSSVSYTFLGGTV